MSGNIFISDDNACGRILSFDDLKKLEKYRDGRIQ